MDETWPLTKEQWDEVRDAVLARNPGQHLHVPTIVEWDGRQIQLPPGWGAFFDSGTLDSVSNPYCVGIDADGEPEVFEAFTVNEAIPNPDKVGRVVMASILAAFAHELIEFILVDGEPIADPHPFSLENWEWMLRRTRRIVNDYCREFPPKPVDPT